MIDTNEIQDRCSCTLVYFKGLPEGNRYKGIYIENAYHKRFNRFMRICSWGLWKLFFYKYDYGEGVFVYLPAQYKKIGRKQYLYRKPFLSGQMDLKLPKITTRDLLIFLEDPDDARFLCSGFLFFKEMKEGDISVYEYYPLKGIDDSSFWYIRDVKAILEAHSKNVDNIVVQGSKIGLGGGLFKTQAIHDENYADLNTDQFDLTIRKQLEVFEKQARELKELGVSMAILENILHQNNILSKLVITRDYRIFLPDYQNMEINMEPLVKAVYFLFLRHPEGLLFKELPDYRKELTEIYLQLKPNGLTDRVRKSIEDVTDPTLNSINEKCARIRAAFILQFDEYFAKNYYIDGLRGQPKKIALPRDLVIWEE